MQYKVILSSVALLALAACTPATQTPPVDDGSPSSVNPAADDSDSMVDDVVIDEGGVGGMHGGVAPVDSDRAMTGPRVVDVMVTDWSFSPTTIAVKKGENVSLRLVGDKGIHSLLVADLGLNVRVSPGESTIVAIPTDKTGSFTGRCGVPCGPGHRDMAFTIVVE